MGPLQTLKPSKALKNQDLVCYLNISSLGWTFEEQMAVYSLTGPTVIKGKFTVCKANM